MTGAIGGIGAGIGAGEAAASGVARADQTSDAAAASPVAGSVKVGQTQSLFATINATVAAVPTVDQTKVAAVRQSLSDGTYAIDPQRIAKKLLGAEQTPPDISPANE